MFLFIQGHVFLDTMDPEEYYAMALNGHRPAPIKVLFFIHSHYSLYLFTDYKTNRLILIILNLCT